MAAQGDAPIARINANARVVAIAAGCLVAAGGAVVVWSAVWGVHGCDETEACFKRMDRDFRAYLAGLVALGLGVLLGGVAAMIAARARRKQA